MKPFLVGAGLLLAMAGMPAAATAQTCTFILSRTKEEPAAQSKAERGK